MLPPAGDRIIHTRDIGSFLLSLCPVRIVVFLLSFLLSFLSGAKADAVAEVSGPAGDYCVSETPSTANPQARNLSQDICLTAAHGYTFAGNGNINFVSLRVTQTGKRSSSQLRSTFRIVKCGKIIDNNYIHPFLSQSVIHLSGVYLSERYLFSICRLRL